MYQHHQNVGLHVHSLRQSDLFTLGHAPVPSNFFFVGFMWYALFVLKLLGYGCDLFSFLSDDQQHALSVGIRVLCIVTLVCRARQLSSLSYPLCALFCCSTL